MTSEGSLCADRRAAWRPQWRVRSEAFLLTPHHLVFRSHGGSEAPSNLVSLCERCHLDLVHGGHLRATSEPPDALFWTARAFEIGA